MEILLMINPKMLSAENYRQTTNDKQEVREHEEVERTWLNMSGRESGTGLDIKPVTLKYEKIFIYCRRRYRFDSAWQWNWQQRWGQESWNVIKNRIWCMRMAQRKRCVNCGKITKERRRKNATKMCISFPFPGSSSQFNSTSFFSSSWFFLFSFRSPSSSSPKPNRHYHHQHFYQFLARRVKKK